MKKKLVGAVLLLLTVVGVYHSIKPLPDHVSYEGTVYAVSDGSVQFFADRTFLDQGGTRSFEHTIFDEVAHMIEGAESYILVDLFLYNDFLGTATTAHRFLSGELTDALLEKKEENPEIIIQVITDPINNLYGGIDNAAFKELRGADISVVYTNLKPLRDSNPMYSAFWRTGLQWLGNSTTTGWLPNPFTSEGPKLSLRSYLSMLNYKANHRKVVLADGRDGDSRHIAALVMSANPHDGSSAHSNTALKVTTKMWRDVLKTEAAVIEFSEGTFVPPPDELLQELSTDEEGSVEVQLLTEGVIEQKALSMIQSLGSEDSLDMAMFYLSDRDIISALKKADEREVKIRILLDPNKDAFGREKDGKPNRQVAHELMKATEGNTEIRWCSTHGEQCHSKLLLVRRGEERELLQGSANYTRRNLSDYNLETNIFLRGTGSTTAYKSAQDFFDDQWLNREGREYSVPYAVYENDSFLKTLSYRFREFSGLSTW